MSRKKQKRYRGSRENSICPESEFLGRSNGHQGMPTQTWEKGYKRRRKRYASCQRRKQTTGLKISENGKLDVQSQRTFRIYQKGGLVE